jgi:hypothetical protein
MLIERGYEMFFEVLRNRGSPRGTGRTKKQEKQKQQKQQG